MWRTRYILGVISSFNGRAVTHEDRISYSNQEYPALWTRFLTGYEHAADTLRYEEMGDVSWLIQAGTVDCLSGFREREHLPAKCVRFLRTKELDLVQISEAPLSVPWADRDRLGFLPQIWTRLWEISEFDKVQCNVCWLYSGTMAWLKEKERACLMVELCVAVILLKSVMDYSFSLRFGKLKLCCFKHCFFFPFFLQTLLKAPSDCARWKSWQLAASGSKPYLSLHPGFRFGLVAQWIFYQWCHIRSGANISSIH